MPDEFDAVVVSTCEHTHAFATLPALQLGKHVYCEKPLTHSIYEARIIREAAAKAGVATQMGTQIHAENNYRRVVELIQTGAIGKVSECHVWVGRAWGLQSPEEAKGARRHRVCAGSPGERRSDSAGTGLGSVAWTGSGTTLQQRLLPGTKVVSLVGLRQRHDVRPGQSLGRSAVLGSETESPEDH